MLNNFEKIISRVRLLLQDEKGHIWNNTDLESFINEGQEEYARRTAILTGHADLKRNPLNNHYEIPEDYNSLILGINAAKDLLTLLPMKHVLDEPYQEGSAEILAEYPANNVFRVHPDPGGRSELREINQDNGTIYNVETTEKHFTINVIDGEAFIEATNTAPVVRETGIVYTAENFEIKDISGEAYCAIDYESGAEIYYNRKPIENFIEIDDTMSLVYFATAKALEQETEYRDVNKAAILRREFNNRIGRGVRRNNNRTKHRSTGVFF